MGHWDLFIKRYLDTGVWLLAMLSSLYCLDGFTYLASRFIGSPILNNVLTACLGAILFGLTAWIVKVYFQPKFGRRGRSKAARQHDGKTKILDAEDFDFRMVMEKRVLTALFYFVFIVILSFLLQGSLHYATGWQQGYSFWGMGGAICAVQFFIGVAIWSSFVQKKTQRNNYAALVLGGIFQIPAFLYSLFTFLIFFVWDERIPDALRDFFIRRLHRPH